MNLKRIRNRCAQALCKLRDAVFADDANCLQCGREIPQNAASRLCDACAATAVAIGDRACLKCGRHMTDEADYCIPCQNHDRAFDFARSPYVYAGAPAKLVRSLKFGNRRYLAKYMARDMVDTVTQAGWTVDAVVPVPLSDAHRRKRGYNQAELLARPIACALGAPLDTTHLIKTRDTAEQARLRGSERSANVEGAYVATDSDAFRDKRVLLVDDVMTTGATAHEIAKVLRKCGAKAILLITYCSAKYRLRTDAGGQQIYYTEDVPNENEMV